MHFERFRWRLKVYANSINWKRSQNGFFGNLITLALFISPGVCAFFLYPCQMQAGWTWYSRWNHIWEWIFSNERSIIDSRLWILEVFLSSSHSCLKIFIVDNSFLVVNFNSDDQLLKLSRIQLNFVIHFLF